MGKVTNLCSKQEILSFGAREGGGAKLAPEEEKAGTLGTFFASRIMCFLISSLIGPFVKKKRFVCGDNKEVTMSIFSGKEEINSCMLNVAKDRPKSDFHCPENSL